MYVRRGENWATQRGWYELVKGYTFPSPCSGKPLKDFMSPTIVDGMLCTKSAGNCLVEKLYVRQLTRCVLPLCCALTTVPRRRSLHCLYSLFSFGEAVQERKANWISLSCLHAKDFNMSCYLLTPSSGGWSHSSPGKRVPKGFLRVC